MKPNTNLAWILLLVFPIFLLSCGRENSDVGNPQDEAFATVASSQADAESDVIFNDVFDNVIGVNDFVGIAYVGVFSGRVANDPIGGRTDTIRCFTITTTHLSSSSPYPVRIVLDFGTGCQGRDGRVRKGKIITTYTNRLLVPGAKATTSFENYYVDSTRVEGVHEISNIGTLTELKLRVVVENARLSRPSGNYTEWESRKVITRVEGNLTPFPEDDIFRVEGQASGKVKRGNLLVAWNTEIVEPLIKKFNCKWVVKGRIRVARLNLSNSSPWIAVLDYGNGTCDNKAILNLNGTSYEITLP